MSVRPLLAALAVTFTAACGPAQAPLQTADAPDLVILNRDSDSITVYPNFTERRVGGADVRYSTTSGGRFMK